MVNEQDIRRALSVVNDPHVPVSIERMGMLRNISIDARGLVVVELGIPCLACPGVSMLKSEIVNVVGRLAGVTHVEVDEGWHHQWDTSMIAPEARIFMQRNGIST